MCVGTAGPCASAVTSHSMARKWAAFRSRKAITGKKIQERLTKNCSRGREIPGWVIKKGAVCARSADRRGAGVREPSGTGSQ